MNAQLEVRQHSTEAAIQAIQQPRAVSNFKH